ncbi:MAG: phosphatase PAP2-related protein [Verrucomicrobiaceae bacterium]
MKTAPASSAKLRIARVLIIITGLALWFWTQALIGSKSPATTGSGIGDAVHIWTAPWNAWLQAHEQANNLLLIASSACIDALGLFVIGMTIFGKSIRPFLGLIFIFTLRQLNQSFTSLPNPPGQIWHATGVPTLLVTYGVSNDLFFSGHTALAVFGAMELFRAGNKTLRVLASAIAIFEVCAVLLLRAHYTMDVYAGAVTALFIGLLAEKIAVPVDLWLNRVTANHSL